MAVEADGGAMRSATTAARVALWAAVAIALAGCTGGGTGADPAGEPSPSALPPSSTAAAPSDGGAPTLRPDLPAADNLAYFDAVNREVIAADADAGGRAFIDALVAAGFDRAAMQVTDDTTTLGERADSIQFAVALGSECLVGQYGPKSDGYQSAVRPALGTGGCLVGDTRPIDW